MPEPRPDVDPALIEARAEAARYRDALLLTLSSLSWCAGYISSDPATTPGTVLDAITAGRAALSPKENRDQ